MCLSERKRGTVSSVLICALKGTPAKHTRGGVGRVKEKARHSTSECPRALLAAAACASLRPQPRDGCVELVELRLLLEQLRPLRVDQRAQRERVADHP